MKLCTKVFAMSRLGTISLTQNTGPKHTATLLFLHGSGATGPNLLEWVTILHKNFSFPHIKIVYPTAPLQPYTPAGMQPSTVWFDRADLSIYAPEKLDSIQNIKNEILNLIAKENANGIPNNRIVIGGFSMGGALSMYTGFNWVPNVAGVFVFGSFLNKNSFVYKTLETSSKPLPPLLQLHGNSDDVVKIEWARETFTNLKAKGVRGEFVQLEKLGHSLNRKGLLIVKDWIDKLLPEL